MNYKIWYYCVSAALVICLLFTFGYYNHANDLQEELENNYQSAFATFVNNSEELAMLCAKAEVSNAPMQTMAIMSRINANALEAENALAHLPFEQQYIFDMSNYYNQLGDYAEYCIDSLASDYQLNNMQESQMRDFAEDMEKTAMKLNELQSVVYDEKMCFKDVRNMGRYFDIKNIGGNDYDISFVFTDLNKAFAEKDRLTYAGKYSEHISHMQAKGFEGEEIDFDAAMEKAKAFIKLLSGEYNTENLRENGESSDLNSIPAYYFMLKEDTEDIYLSVSRQGGQILSYYNNRPVIEQTVSVGEARTIAERLVGACGYKTMQVYKQYRKGNIISFEISFIDEKNIIYYPDRLLV